MGGLGHQCNHRVHEAILGDQGPRSMSASAAAAYPEELAVKYANLAAREKPKRATGRAGWIG